MIHPNPVLLPSIEPNPSPDESVKCRLCRVLMNDNDLDDASMGDWDPTICMACEEADDEFEPESGNDPIPSDGEPSQ